MRPRDIVEPAPRRARSSQIGARFPVPAPIFEPADEDTARSFVGF